MSFSAACRISNGGPCISANSIKYTNTQSFARTARNFGSIDQISFWPWILALIGISILPSSISRNRGLYGLIGTLWLVGMAVLFYFDVFWPGILILIGSSILLGILKEGR